MLQVATERERPDAAPTMASSALDALGLDYDDSDGESSEEEAPAQAAPAPAPAAASIPPPAAAPRSALPDAGALLGDMPDEVDWDARAEPDEPAYDPVGTSYNNVSLPTSMASAAEKHNMYADKRRAPDRTTLYGNPGGSAGSTSASGAASGASTTAGPSSGRGAAAAPPRRSSGALLPPQLRRPNVTTEDLGAMRAKKRSRPAAE